MKNEDNISAEQPVPGLEEFLRAHPVPVPPVPRLQTPDCPSLGRFAVITREPSLMTAQEQEHIDSSCAYCKKIISKFERQRASETGTTADWNLSEQDHKDQVSDKSENTMFNTALPKADRQFTTRRLRWPHRMALGTLLSVCCVIGGWWGYQHTTTLHKPLRPTTNPALHLIADKPGVFSDGSGVQIALAKGHITAQGIPSDMHFLIDTVLSGGKSEQPLTASGRVVGPTAGGHTSAGPRAPQHLQPAGSVVTGLPAFNWTPAAHFGFKRYRVEYRRLDTPAGTMPEYKTAGVVPASATRYVAPQPLPPGEYTWRVSAVGITQPDLPDRIASADANFVVVAPGFQSSDTVMGAAYARVGRWDQAEARFHHLTVPQATDTVAAAQARKATGSALLRWLQNQQRAAHDAEPSQRT